MTLLTLALVAQLAQPIQSGPSRIRQLTFADPEVGTVLYGISVPSDYDPQRPRPLVLALHPGGSGPYYGTSFMRSMWLSGLHELGAIIVTPDCPTRSWTDPVSERAVMALVQKVLGEYAVDRRRILVTGFSLGGRGTWFFSSRHADLFTAAIPMAASVGNEPTDRLGTIPSYIIHSRDDQVSPFAPAEQNAQTLEKLGRPIRFEALRGITHFEMGEYVDSLARAGRWIAERWDKRAE